MLRPVLYGCCITNSSDTVFVYYVFTESLYRKPVRESINSHRSTCNVVLPPMPSFAWIGRNRQACESSDLQRIAPSVFLQRIRPTGCGASAPHRRHVQSQMEHLALRKTMVRIVSSWRIQPCIDLAYGLKSWKSAMRKITWPLDWTDKQSL